MQTRRWRLSTEECSYSEIWRNIDQSSKLAFQEAGDGMTTWTCRLSDTCLWRASSVSKKPRIKNCPLMKSINCLKVKCPIRKSIKYHRLLAPFRLDQCYTSCQLYFTQYRRVHAEARRRPMKKLVFRLTWRSKKEKRTSNAIILSPGGKKVTLLCMGLSSLQLRHPYTELFWVDWLLAIGPGKLTEMSSQSKPNVCFQFMPTSSTFTVLSFSIWPYRS